MPVGALSLVSLTLQLKALKYFDSQPYKVAAVFGHVLSVPKVPRATDHTLQIHAMLASSGLLCMYTHEGTYRSICLCII